MKVYVVVHETANLAEITGYDVGPAFSTRDAAVKYIESFGTERDGYYWRRKDWKNDVDGNSWYVDDLEVW